MSVSYTLRLPDDLKRLIDSAANSGGVSTAQLVVDALWKYLERKPNYDPPAIQPGPPAMFGSELPTSPQRTAAGIAFSIPGVSLGMAAPAIPLPESQPVAIPIASSIPEKLCSECDRDMIGKTIKGRGIVYACPDVGCPMYGIERK